MPGLSWEKIRFFKLEEFACPCCGKNNIDMHLVHMLDHLRVWMAQPLKITSGYRCEKHNREVGGVPNSAHLKGLAVDIHVPDSKFRFFLIHFAIIVGFQRIGVAKNFVHLDIDEEKPQHVLWLYQKDKGGDQYAY